MRYLFTCHLLRITESVVEIILEFLHVEDIPLSDSTRLRDSDTEDAQFFLRTGFTIVGETQYGENIGALEL